VQHSIVTEHVLKQTNRLLERVRRELSIVLLFPYGAYYSRVLRTTHRQLGRPADFAIQSDRELIGRTLIFELRGYNITGRRLSRVSRVARVSDSSDAL
jgi:hypothetical protein